MKLQLSIKYDTVFGEELKVAVGRNKYPMRWSDGNFWRIALDLPEGRYKYVYELWRGDSQVRVEMTAHKVKLDKDTSRRDWWQDRPESWYGSLASVFGPFGTRASGIAVPVFSLRSRKSFGVGEFTDLKLLVDFAASCGMKCIQLLPINDTSARGDWLDSYPYSACSSFALHPQFINLELAGVSPDEEFCTLRDELNSLDQLDYERVNAAKDRYLREAFAADGGKTVRGRKFKSFVEKNRSWLLPYACFRVLTLENAVPDFSKWGKMAKYSDVKVEKYYAGHRDAVDYYMWVQFHLDRQLSDVVAYARSKNVHLKGDLPIGVGRYSADSWQHSRLFNMDSCAGAPPDFFSRDGQNWGFPTYNWEAMAKDGFKWWKERLGKMGEYFDAYRIDHILGFFRIWEIPYNWGGCSGSDVSGMYGHFNPSLPYSREEIRFFDRNGEHPLFLEDPHREGFYNPMISAFDQPAFALMDEFHKSAFSIMYDDYFFHRHNAFWKESALKKLGALTGSSGMLACGEDLGMMADCVPEVMEEFGILSLEIPRMPKRFGDEFGQPASWPYLSVCTTGTHDMSPARLWWVQNPEQAQHFYNSILGKEGEAPADLTSEVCRDMLSTVMNSPSMLCIIPLQDWLACSENLRLDDIAKLPLEQINDPSNGKHYWRYRMNTSLEGMLADKAFIKDVYSIVKKSDR